MALKPMHSTAAVIGSKPLAVRARPSQLTRCLFGFVCLAMPFIQVPKSYAGESCEDLWHQRNSIFAKSGYCFKSAEAQAVFGPGCFAPFGKLSRDQEKEVNRLVSLEAANGCDPKGQASGTSVFRPIIVGRDRELDACTSRGQIVGLDPKGDGFLSVRSGPKGKEVDRVFNGQTVDMCDEAGDWVGIVYAMTGQDQAVCNLERSLDKPVPYTGPCRYGWVHKEYVKQISG